MQARFPPLKDMRFGETPGRVFRGTALGRGSNHRSGFHSSASSPQTCLLVLAPRTPMITSQPFERHNTVFFLNLASSIRSLRRLRSLRIGWCAGALRQQINDFLSVISSLEDLRDLALPLDRWGDTSSPNFVYDFPPIRRLRLQGLDGDVSSILVLNRHTTSVPLEHLEISDVLLRYDDERHDARAVVEAYDTIILHVLATCADTLTVVKLALGASCVITILLQPLTWQLRRLRVCNTGYWYDKLVFRDDDLRAAARAWPQLTTFALSWDWWYQMNAALAFADVVQFICACSRLTALRLRALATGAQGPMDTDAIYNIPVVCAVDEGRIQAPSRLALVLRFLLPNLTHRQEIGILLIKDWSK